MTNPLGDWTIQQYTDRVEINTQADASPSVPVGTQTIEYDVTSNSETPGLITLDDSEPAQPKNIRIELTASVDSGDQNDIGVVFGWQDASNWYTAEGLVDGASTNAPGVRNLVVTDHGSVLDRGSNLGTAPDSDADQNWQDLRFDIWDSPNGVTVRLEATERDQANPYSNMTAINEYTIEPVSGGLPGQIGLSFSAGGKADGTSWVDDVRVYADGTWP